MQILIVEDHSKVADYVAESLKEEGFNVKVARDGDEGLEAASHHEFDCIVLDINLPKRDGFSFCRELRRHQNTPVLMLTARTDRADVVRGLNEGADDYLKKPFHIEELIARVRTLTRRAVQRQGPTYQWQDIKLDASIQRVLKKEKEIKLAPREYSLLEHLFRHQGTTCERHHLLEEVWGEGADLMYSRTLEVHIAYVRKKLRPDLIVTVPNRGYYIPQS